MKPSNNILYVFDIWALPPYTKDADPCSTESSQPSLERYPCPSHAVAGPLIRLRVMRTYDTQPRHWIPPGLMLRCRLDVRGHHCRPRLHRFVIHEAPNCPRIWLYPPNPLTAPILGQQTPQLSLPLLTGRVCR